MMFKLYHGTIRKSADEIIASEHIDPSEGPQNYLGNGRYFYENIEDAVTRAKITRSDPEKQNLKEAQKAIAVIEIDFECPDKYIINFEQDKNQELFIVLANILNSQAEHMQFDTGFDSDPIVKAIRRQTYLCNWLWRDPSMIGKEKIYLMIGKFPVSPENGSLIGEWKWRTEYCISKNFTILTQGSGKIRLLTNQEISSYLI